MTRLYRQKLELILELLIKAMVTTSPTRKARYIKDAEEELKTLKQIKQ